MKSSLVCHFRLAIISFFAVGCIWSCGPSQDQRDAALAKADSLAAQRERSQPARLDPSTRPEDVALCETLASFETKSDLSRIDSLLSIAKADPNCFCAVDVYHRKNRLLNSIPVVKDHVADGEYVTQETDPLELAVGTGDWELVKVLVQHGANINGQAGHPNVLNDAIFSDNFDAVDQLVKLGADPQQASLARVESKRMTEKMLGLGCPAPSIGLHAALRLSDRHLASFLLSKNPKPMGELNGDRLALNEEEDWQFLHFLFEQDDAPGVEIAWNAESFAKQAVQYGDCGGIEALVKRGWNLQEPDGDASYIRDAIWAKRPAIVECLLNLGAPSNQPGKNAMESAILLNSLECIKILLAHHVNVEKGSNIEYARASGANAEVLELLAK